MIQEPTPALTRATLLEFMRRHRFAVQASAAPSGSVQAAVVGIAVADNFQIVFDTLDTTRKAQNLAHRPLIAFVIGGVGDAEEQTVQYEGIADRPVGDLQSLQELYFRTFPDGRDRLVWPGLIYVRTKPLWVRYSDYRSDPAVIVELDAGQLAGLE